MYSAKLKSENLYQKKYSKVGYIWSLRCKNFTAKDLLNLKEDYYTKDKHTLLIAENTQLPFLTKLLKELNIRIDSNLNLAIKAKDYYEIYDVYNQGFKFGASPIVTQLNKVFKYTSAMKYKDRKNISNIKIRTGSVITIKYSKNLTFHQHMQETRTKYMDNFSKFHYAVFQNLKDLHNFSYNMTVASAWFGNYTNGTDAGLAKLFFTDKIDISSTGGILRPARIPYYDYFMNDYVFDSGYIFRRPQNKKWLTNQFSKPFSQQVWLYLFTVIGIFGVCLKVAYKIEGFIVKHIRITYSWASAFLIALGSLFQQGSTIFPKGYSGRLTFFVLLLMSFLVYNYYTSSIISSLLSAPPRTIRNLYDLAHSNLKIGLENAPWAVTWFFISNQSDVQYIYTEKLNSLSPEADYFYTVTEGLTKVKEGGFAYHTMYASCFPLISKTFSQKAICELDSIAMIPPAPSSIMIQKHSQYFEMFQISLAMMRERGHLNQIFLKWKPAKPACFGNTVVASVGIDQTFYAFLMFFLGLVASLVVFAVELIWFSLSLDQKLQQQFKITQTCWKQCIKKLVDLKNGSK